MRSNVLLFSAFILFFTGCTVKVVPFRMGKWGPEYLAEDPDHVMMVWKMDVLGDMREVHLMLTPDEMVDMRDALNRALQVVKIPR